MTTRASHEDIVKAAEAGVSGYILKPFTPPVLKDKIDSLLRDVATPDRGACDATA